MNNDIALVVDNQLCFSCGVCSVICPEDCINFCITNSGRLIPKIDYEKCINCGLCFYACPGIDEKYEINKDKIDFFGKVVNSYLGRTNNKKIFQNSQSGGMVTEVLSYLFDKKLIRRALVVRMDYSLNPKPVYYFANKKEDLYASQKSKYLQVNILEALKNIEKLDEDIAVVGTGCQIEGLEKLKKVKPKIYNRVKYKLGLICDGILSYLSNDFFKLKGPYRIIYKDKNNPNYINANVTLEAENTKVTVDRSIRFFLKNYLKPSRCFICFNKMNIYADFVFGDPWGIEKYDTEHGESVVITRSKKADEIIQNIVKERRATLKPILYEKILKGQQIERRKEIVFHSLAVYKKHGKILPKYYRNKKLPENINSDVERQILFFWNMEKKEKEENIRFIRRKLLLFNVKRRIKQFIKGVLKK